MPQRFLRPGITNSERWNACDWIAQSLYVRILTLVDDFGQYDARPAVIWGQCFQIWNSQHPDQPIDLQQVAQMLQQLAASRLIEIYEDASGKRFLQVSQWQERIREGCKRKWPSIHNLQQVAASCSVLLPPSSPPSPTPSPSPLCRVAPDERKVGKVELMTKARIVLAYLNEQAGRSFREAGNNLPWISARLAEVGEDVEGVKKMIDRQVRRWKGTEQAEYLRPETLFNKTKFNTYYDNRDLEIFNSANGAGGKENPRNAHTYKSVSNYEEAGRRKQAEQEQADLARKVAENEAAPSPIEPHG